MENRSIILFDGVCNLCNSAVQFIIKRDRDKRFSFAALQSVAGQQLLKEYQLSTTDLDSFVLIENNESYKKSTAALRVAKQLSGAWKMFYGFMIIPAFLRDAVYSLIGKNRYKWFGKKDACMIPTPELKARFLND